MLNDSLFIMILSGRTCPSVEPGVLQNSAHPSHTFNYVCCQFPKMKRREYRITLNLGHSVFCSVYNLNYTLSENTQHIKHLHETIQFLKCFVSGSSVFIVVKLLLMPILYTDLVSGNKCLRWFDYYYMKYQVPSRF